MAKTVEDGRVWGRPEALDTLGRLPGRRLRFLGSVLGVAAIVAGVYLGFSSSGGGLGLFAAPPPAPPAGPETCATLSITLRPGHFPAEGVGAQSVLQLSRVDRNGAARVIVPTARVIKVAKGVNGSLQMSVLVRTELDGSDTVNEVNSANVDQSIIAAVLYDVDPTRTLNTCRDKQ